MINLTTLVDGSDLSLPKKWYFTVFSNVYLAENVQDYLEHKKHLECPWYTFCPLYRFADIVIPNVGIDNLMHFGPPFQRKVRIHDSTASEIVYWGDGNDRTGKPLRTFEEVTREFGRHVPFLIMRTYLDCDFTFVVDALGRSDRLRESMLEKIVALLAQPELVRV